MKLELLREARGKIEHATAALEDVEIELDRYEKSLVNMMIQQTRDNVEYINRMIERTQKAR